MISYGLLGGGFRSSTFWLNLGRFCHSNYPNVSGEK